MLENAPCRSIPQNTPLLRIFNLDNLNATGDPQPDGRFDFVTGLTINPALGIVMFPVLEPFGSSLERRISAAGGDVAKYVYRVCGYFNGSSHHGGLH